MTEEQMLELVSKPNSVEEAIVHGASIGMTEEESLVFYFFYDGVNWIVTGENNRRYPIRNWRSWMSLYKLNNHIRQRITDKLQQQKMEHWKSEQRRRSAERIRENQLRGKEHQKVVVATSDDGWNNYSWYLEQVQIHGAKVNNELEKSEINGKPVWRYK